MDGLKMVVPNTCGDKLTCINQKDINLALFKNQDQLSIFPAVIPEPIHELRPCEGCQTGDITRHNGAYCFIRDWKITEREDRKNPRKGDLKKDRDEEIASGAIVKFYTLFGKIDIK